MKKFISFLVTLAIVLGLSVSVGTVNKVSAEDDSSRPYIEDYTYEYESIPTRHIYSDDLYNLKFTVDGNEYILNVNEDTGTISALHCDTKGTVWIRVKLNIYFYSYELQGNDFTFYCFDRGTINVDDSEYAYAIEYRNSEGIYVPLPSTEELQVLLESNTLTALPTADLTPTDSPSESPSGAPSEVPSTAPTVSPSAAPSIAPSTVPTTVPSEVPQVTPTDTPDETQEPEVVTYAKVQTSGNKLKLIDSDGNVSKTATFNKKKATLNSNGKKIKSVKTAVFSKKGTVVYVKKNGNAYYLQGKKSKLIAKKVSSVKKNGKGFAVKLITKNGKKINLSK